jgi:MotA/TolQ/ExbB proton channel family
VFVLLLILVITLHKTLIVGVAADSSYFSLVIAGTFVCAFLYSYIKARRLRREWMGINRIQETVEKSLTPNSDAERLAFSILNHARPEDIRIKDLVDSYYSTQEVPLRTLTVISGLMVTLGLIGTILGLIISIGGLESIMTQVEGISQGIFGGIKETIRGMAIAFYSTLFGAVLGAVVLRMLSVSLTNSLVHMSCGLFEYLELLPKSAEQQILEPLRVITLQKFTSATLDSRLANISAQLELCVAALKGIGR